MELDGLGVVLGGMEQVEPTELERTVFGWGFVEPGATGGAGQAWMLWVELVDTVFWGSASPGTAGAGGAGRGQVTGTGGAAQGVAREEGVRRQMEAAGGG